MPENPDGSSGQAESVHGESTCSTRTKSKGSLGAGGQKKLDRDQIQWITGSRRKCARPGPRPRDHGETNAGRKRPGWNRQTGNASSTRTKSRGAHRDKEQCRRRQGKDGGKRRGRALNAESLRYKAAKCMALGAAQAKRSQQKAETRGKQADCPHRPRTVATAESP